MTEMSLIVEIDYKDITENLKTRDMREGVKTIIKTGMARIIVEIVTKKLSTKTKTDIRMTAMARLVGLKREINLYDEDDIFHSEIERVYKFYKQWVKKKKWQ